jgi:hypothetical protein
MKEIDPTRVKSTLPQINSPAKMKYSTYHKRNAAKNPNSPSSNKIDLYQRSLNYQVMEN